MVYLGNRDQHTTLRKKVTNQTSPYLEILFFINTPYISNVIQNPGLLPIATASVTVGPQLKLGNKNSLAFALDIGSLMVTGRFRDFGITHQEPGSFSAM